MNWEVENRKRRGKRVLLGVLAVWGLAVAVAVQAGVFSVIYPRLFFPLIGLGIVVPVVVYAMSRGFRAYIEIIGLPSITAFHIWRIGAALLFFWYGAHDLLPPIFVQVAGWGDLTAGLLALGVTLLPESYFRYLFFGFFGSADFVVAVGTAAAMFILNDPRMAGIQTLPLALIPFYGVGISGSSHIMAFDLLRRHVGMGDKVEADAGDLNPIG
jgi:hypothetical protein